MTTWQDVSSSSGPWVHYAASGCLPSLLDAAATEDVLLVQLDGTRMHSLEDLFREYVREFSFPEYFGWNWAAFGECMKVLDGQPARAYLTIITHGDEILSDEPEELNTYLRQLEKIGRRWGSAFALGPAWGGGEVPFHTVVIDGSDTLDIPRTHVDA
ncbi:barstar family protein [Kribbella sp. NPDC000426]|uniref:barstar family protein n=1 Tax=Kribbella sp. NPDC000426 TaxID=3154255 RepID=UPI0033320FF7